MGLHWAGFEHGIDHTIFFTRLLIVDVKIKKADNFNGFQKEISHPLREVGCHPTSKAWRFNNRQGSRSWCRRVRFLMSQFRNAPAAETVPGGFIGHAENSKTCRVQDGAVGIRQSCQHRSLPDSPAHRFRRVPLLTNSSPRSVLIPEADPCEGAQRSG